MKEIAVQDNMELFQNVLDAAMKIPGVRINREQFLRRTLSKYYKEDVVKTAIEYNPARAGISSDELNNIARSCIDFETKKVTAISAAAGVPGGFGMAVTIPGDLAQYFAHVIIILQKLIYLFGWRDLFREDEDFDDETFSLITVFLGVMFGVQAANKVMAKVAAAAAARANKVIAAKPLTKGVLYPIIKKIAVAIGARMNKGIFAGGVAKVIPFVGALTSGGVTFFTFRPMCYRLKRHLETLPIANISFYENSEVMSHYNTDINELTQQDFDVEDI
ncbi:hypothetical protein ACHAL6_07340 [Proteiniclasticum sp. C24MP]|uniref:hypothetical protein n=1 Tax=Proteiniclasticum sp. C24MP TaxID=3374101 RepID=UPI003754164B